MLARIRTSFLIMTALALVLVGSFSWYSLTSTSALVVTVDAPVIDVDGVGAATQLNVTIRNAGGAPAEPTFWVMWSPFVRNWGIVTGDRALPAGATSHYTIRTGDVRVSVPEGAMYTVKVLDQASGTYFRSDLQRLILIGTPPLRNPDLRLWSRDLQAGSREPFGWDIQWGVAPGDSASATPTASGSGAAIELHEDGTGSSQTWLHIQQPVTQADLLRLRDATVTLCWSRAVDYVQDSVGGPIAVSGIELIGGGRRAWMAVSSTENLTYDLPGHRIFVVRANVNGTDCHSVPLREMIDFVGTEAGDTLFILFAAAWPDSPGTYAFTLSSLALG